MNTYFISPKNVIITFILLLFFFVQSSAQLDEKNTKWMEYLEELADSETDPALLENLFEDLSYLSENPFDLNTVTKQDLERLPFLSALQIENLLYYLYRNSPLMSIYELKNVDGLDMQAIAYLLPFIYVGTVEKKIKLDPKQIVRYGNHLLLIRSDYCFQEKTGFKDVSEEEFNKNPNKYYLGENYYLSVKYSFQYKDKIQFGFTGEKDTGEALWNKNHKGFDFYSGSLVLKDMGIIRSLYLGDYRFSMGQGLILNTGFSPGKTSEIANINKPGGNIKRHFSTGESGFFRGAAIDLKLIKNLNFQFFYSHQKVDANADSSTIFTFKTDGYNRTIKDLEKRRQAGIDLIGGNLQWKATHFNMGLECAYYAFGGKELNPEAKAYNLYYLRGKDNFNAGGYYGFRSKTLVFQGETAISRNGSVATLNTLEFKPASFIDLVISQRNYAPDYQAHFSKALSESSSIQNESGIYTGIKLQFLRYWEWNVYLDCFRFPWLKFGIDAPSSGTDALLQLNYTPKKNFMMNLRYKRKEKSKNTTAEKGSVAVCPFEQHRWRYQLNYQAGMSFAFKTQLDYNVYVNPDKSQDAGKSVSQTFSYIPEGKAVQLDLALSYFNAGEWNNRISVYEKNILYAFSFPTYYGEGLRYYAVVRWKISRALSLYLKIASTHYYDRDKISSDLEEINGSEKSDLYGLIRWKF